MENTNTIPTFNATKPDFAAMADTLTGFRNSLIDYISEYQSYAESLGLYSVDLTDFSSAPVIDTGSDDEYDTCTIDNLERNCVGDVVVCASSCNGSVEIKVRHLSFDMLLDVAMFLSENKDTIIEYLLEDASDE